MTFQGPEVPRLFYCQDRDHVPVRADFVDVEWPRDDGASQVAAGPQVATIQGWRQPGLGPPRGPTTFPLLLVNRDRDDEQLPHYRDRSGQLYEVYCTESWRPPRGAALRICTVHTNLRGMPVTSSVITDLTDEAQLPRLIEAEHRTILKWIKPRGAVRP